MKISEKKYSIVKSGIPASETTDLADQLPEVVTSLTQDYLKWDESNLEPGWIDPHPENVILEEQRLQQIRAKSLPPLN